MTMRVHFIQHVKFEGLGNIEPWLRSAGYRIAGTRMDLNQPLPTIDDFDWLIVMGGPMGATDDDQFPWLSAEKTLIRQAVDNGKRVLGICLGAQLIAAAMGARVFKNPLPEIGWFEIRRPLTASKHPLGTVLPERMEVLHWHGDTFQLPTGAIRLASSDACENQAFALGESVLALQFHLEVTIDGAKSLIEECNSDLVDGPFVQSARDILAQPERFLRIHECLRTVLRSLVSQGKKLD